ncbi:peroxiredoxin [Frankia sp. CNm7]|uniref:thioredoxin-dependent peroxiredoxin n=1 Tax=Frankia nepalensis TaxID=1836974 RepID=A0A937RHI0_9ACTN|nr:peroxiredoxin [Frankia nepalensis]MBL7497710.1 peroxiredoxin [Frankia nepalensis]MBL7514296.1 peroxiredoxin [Frankia nepalensis]MBL7523298.1 peroxiredoxin [Frankia nepalensis]MBL7630252.1 peroxiredoxin [Frankia nepalensis]
MATPAVGQQAPDFTLPGLVVRDGEATHGDYSLASAKGTPVVLAFYPGDETPVCTKQLCSYADSMEVFSGVGAQVWGISPQSIDSHERFAKNRGLSFPLLADVDRTVARLYGIAMPGLGLRRSVFLVGGDGVLRWKNVGLIGVTYATADEIGKELARL